jgi:hypothetical protein
MPRYHHRQKGMGSVQLSTRATRRYRAVQPQKRGEPIVIIWECDSRWGAEKALKAWYVVGAVALLAGLGKSEDRMAS